MNELTIKKVTNGVIATNFKEFKAELVETLKEYENLIVTEQNCSEMKDSRKTLTASVKAIDNKRKDIKKEFLAPLTVFEDECKEAISLIEKVSSKIKDMTDVFDEKERQIKRDYAVEAKALVVTEYKESEKELSQKYIDRIETDRPMVTLVATSKKKIYEDIREQAGYLWISQEREKQNINFVNSQLESTSKLLDLSTPITINDVQHLFSDYENLDTVNFTTKLTDIATRRKESEEAAVKAAEAKRLAILQAEEAAKQKAIEAAESLKVQEIEEAQEVQEAEKVETLEPKINFANFTPVIEKESPTWEWTIKVIATNEQIDQIEKYLSMNLFKYEVK